MTIINDTRRDDLSAKVKIFAKAEAQGQNARPALARELVLAAADGVINTDDCKELYIEFAKAKQAKSVLNNAAEDPADEKSLKVQVSKFNTFVKFGMRGTVTGNGFNPLDVFDDTMRVVNAFNASRDTKLSGSAFDNLLKVARKQLHEDHSAADLTTTEIEYILTPEDKGEPTEVDILEGELKKLRKLRDGNKEGSAPTFPSPQMDAAIDTLQNRVDELNALAQANEDELQLAALLAKKAAQGASVVQAQPTEVEPASGVLFMDELRPYTIEPVDSPENNTGLYVESSVAFTSGGNMSLDTDVVCID